MSVSGKKEFDVKQILRLHWRWFSHPSQGSLNSGSCLQPEGYEQRGTSVQGKLKNHSQDRNRPKKGSSSVHHNILAPVTRPGPVHQTTLQKCQEQNLTEHLEANEDTPKAVTRENFFKEAREKRSQNLEMMADYNKEDSSARLYTQHPDEVNTPRSEEHFHAINHAEKTLHKMENYLKEKKLCDVLLIAGHLRIPAHRLVLSAVSDYFAAMFTNDVLEANQEEVRMEGVDPNALKSLVQYAYTDLENSSMFSGDLECQKLLMEAMKYHLLPERRLMMQSPRTKPRKSTVGALYAVGGMDAMKGVVTLEGPMYAVGGHDGWSYLNTVERWDPEGHQWNYVASMSIPRSTVGVVALNNRYDPKNDSWSTMAPLSVPRDAVAVCSLGEKLYVVGGYDGHTYLNTVESYDAQKNEWNEVLS
ncbi:Kelch-like protein 4 [Fukomys damarensis]|uniref:Kelch-like protein 4 n=1 Tax=Fukomys damarensis TaxID=885580 RepID=A0A091D633_FUKDA|nr:Kelch-like protein 4 [Fukomys damarensis]